MNTNKPSQHPRASGRGKETIRVLLVEDQADDAQRVCDALAKAEDVTYVVLHERTVTGALPRIRTDQADAVLLDLTLPDAQGMEALERIYDKGRHIPIVVLTELDDRELAFASMEKGAQDYLVKRRVNGEVIRRVLRYAFSRKHVEDDLMRSQEQLRQAQKMEGLGLLAGGVAHDFNNLLTSILGFASFAAAAVEEGGPVHQDIREIIHAGKRAATLTRQLLAFSRKEMLHLQPLDINDIVRNMDQILRRTIGEDVELVTVLGEDLGSIVADAGQMEQVVMNLAVNARDAMPRGGALTIQTSPIELDEPFCRGHLGLEPGPHIMLSISDTGHGMSKEVCKRVFEPFFTTKSKDRGTGLGLSSVYGIVKQSKGHIEVESAPGVETEFRVYLPMGSSPVAWSGSVESESAPTGDETVLVVEDEDTLRRLASRILKGLGYTVLEARNGAVGLEVFDSARDEIDLVLTDIVMPQIGGPEMVERLRRADHEFKVLYMSGFADERLIEHGFGGNQLRLLKKPYSREQLAQYVRTVLDEDESLKSA